MSAKICASVLPPIPENLSLFDLFVWKFISKISSETRKWNMYGFYDKNSKELNTKGDAAAASGGLIVGERRIKSETFK